MKPKILSLCAGCCAIASAMVHSASAESKDYTMTFEKINSQISFTVGSWRGDFNKRHKDLWSAANGCRAGLQKQTPFVLYVFCRKATYSFCTYGYDLMATVVIFSHWYSGKPQPGMKPERKRRSLERFEAILIGNESRILDSWRWRPELFFNLKDI